MIFFLAFAVSKQHFTIKTLTLSFKEAAGKLREFIREFLKKIFREKNVGL